MTKIIVVLFSSLDMGSVVVCALTTMKESPVGGSEFKPWKYDGNGTSRNRVLSSLIIELRRYIWFIDWIMIAGWYYETRCLEVTLLKSPRLYAHSWLSIILFQQNPNLRKFSQTATVYTATESSEVSTRIVWYLGEQQGAAKWAYYFEFIDASRAYKFDYARVRREQSPVLISTPRGKWWEAEGILSSKTWMSCKSVNLLPTGAGQRSWPVWAHNLSKA